MAFHIAILGWGSLLWDLRPDFDDYHGLWELDGPELKIEFSRVSQTRSGALTLVVDPLNGTSCRVAHTKSKRSNPEDAICDLRSREGTTRSNLGFYFADGSRSQAKDAVTLSMVKAWAATKTVDVVVWTDLSSNFQKYCGNQFSVEAAFNHLKGLDEIAKAGAVEYVRRAPTFIKTPLRKMLETEPWFKQVKNG